MLMSFANNGRSIDVDTCEFGKDGMGAIIDRLSGIHGAVSSIKPRKGESQEEKTALIISLNGIVEKVVVVESTPIALEVVERRLDEDSRTLLKEGLEDDFFKNGYFRYTNLNGDTVDFQVAAATQE
jgi:hypothetical protein